MARVVAPIAGGIVGFIVGGPQGALWGWQIGAAVGNAIDPQVIPGPRIGEISAQTSQEGGPRPIVFGLSPPMPGNIIFAGPPRIVRRKKRSGKGGPKVETESVYRTYAIGVCEGPITAFYRIWRNGTLVYDRSDDPQLTTAENNEFLLYARLFLGSFEQDPSPDIEKLVTPAPAHRGTAYMVMANEDLTDLRGMIPQFTFQVVRCEGEFRTSEIYPIEILDASESAVALLSGSLAVPPGPTIITTEMDPEAIDGTVDVLSGALRDPLVVYEMDPEAIDGGLDLVEGELRVALITYSDADVEGIDGAVDLIGGSLT